MESNTLVVVAAALTQKKGKRSANTSILISNVAIIVSFRVGTYYHSVCASTPSSFARVCVCVCVYLGTNSLRLRQRQFHRNISFSGCCSSSTLTLKGLRGIRNPTLRATKLQIIQIHSSSYVIYECNKEQLYYYLYFYFYFY
eukprot:GHVU01088834.1.p1 GENE.GHVU01088834.1~~GHVU01088834.1.p1  ORF type:complete len:142 (+),score=7.43 GHVU01088834.1:198-623(+)